jgi:hypothetical protein
MEKNKYMNGKIVFASAGGPAANGTTVEDMQPGEFMYIAPWAFSKGGNVVLGESRGSSRREWRKDVLCVCLGENQYALSYPKHVNYVIQPPEVELELAEKKPGKFLIYISQNPRMYEMVYADAFYMSDRGDLVLRKEPGNGKCAEIVARYAPHCWCSIRHVSAMDDDES